MDRRINFLNIFDLHFSAKFQHFDFADSFWLFITVRIDIRLIIILLKVVFPILHIVCWTLVFLIQILPSVPLEYQYALLFNIQVGSFDGLTSLNLILNQIQKLIANLEVDGDYFEYSCSCDEWEHVSEEGNPKQSINRCWVHHVHREDADYSMFGRKFPCLLRDLILLTENFPSDLGWNAYSVLGFFYCLDTLFSNFPKEDLPRFGTLNNKIYTVAK